MSTGSLADGFRVWYLARCVECVMDLPFPDEHQRDLWAYKHHRPGHTVRRLTERRWCDPDWFPPPVAQRTGQLGPNETVAGSNPAGGTFSIDKFAQELTALTPAIDAAKVGTAHEGHDGWQSLWQRPGEVLCGCGESLNDILTGVPAPPPVTDWGTTT